MTTSTLIFEIKTIQSGAFRSLIDSIKDILIEANLRFTKNGITLNAAKKPTHEMSIIMNLMKDKFQIYELKEEKILGVDMVNLHKLIKTMNNDDSLTLYYDKLDPNNLGIRMENDKKNCITDYKLKLLDLNPDKEFKLPNDSTKTYFQTILSVPSQIFHKIIKDMANISDSIEITSMSDILTFTGKGDFASQSSTLKQKENKKDDESIKISKKAENNEIIQGLYELKNLTTFTKCVGLCSSVELYLKNDYPLFIKYLIADLGYIYLILSPKVNNTKLSKDNLDSDNEEEE
jgi:proliferating cell nuclear antigen